MTEKCFFWGGHKVQTCVMQSLECQPQPSVVLLGCRRVNNGVLRNVGCYLVLPVVFHSDTFPVSYSGTQTWQCFWNPNATLISDTHPKIEVREYLLPAMSCTSSSTVGTRCLSLAPHTSTIILMLLAFGTMTTGPTYSAGVSTGSMISFSSKSWILLSIFGWSPNGVLPTLPIGFGFNAISVLPCLTCGWGHVCAACWCFSRQR